MALRWRNHPILRSSIGATDVLESSAFPLIPFASRVANGRFTYAGRTVQLSANFPPEPHTIHGQCWRAPWRVVEQSTKHVVLTRTHNGTDWPWRYSSKQQFEFEQDTLELTLEVTNLDHRPMPAGLGWHPFFEKAGAHVAVAEFAGAVEDIDVDDAIEWSNAATITWPTHQLTLSADEVFQRVIVFTKPANAFCIEPITLALGALNQNDPHAEGIVLLEPGATLRGSIRLAVDPLV